MTHVQARDIFTRNGVTVAGWAKRHGFSQTLVYKVLSGRRQALRGQSLEIAVALGIKPCEERAYESVDDVLKKLQEVKPC
ncbi:MAG: DNA-binding protein [Pseudohongiella sp.]|nr:DNA-binding protein [Pseudohongiella sp.]